LYSFYQGLLDEIRISNVLRYVAGFSPPETVFPPDENTLALVHLDEGLGKAARNASPMGGGMGDGFLLYGGSAAGPEWIPSDLFLYDWQLFLPSINQ
jgi:hypothetical protein